MHCQKDPNCSYHFWDQFFIGRKRVFCTGNASNNDHTSGTIFCRKRRGWLGMGTRTVASAAFVQVIKEVMSHSFGSFSARRNADANHFNVSSNGRMDRSLFKLPPFALLMVLQFFRRRRKDAPIATRIGTFAFHRHQPSRRVELSPSS